MIGAEPASRKPCMSRVGGLLRWKSLPQLGLLEGGGGVDRPQAASCCGRFYQPPSSNGTALGRRECLQQETMRDTSSLLRTRLCEKQLNTRLFFRQAHVSLRIPARNHDNTRPRPDHPPLDQLPKNQGGSPSGCMSFQPSFPD